MRWQRSVAEAFESASATAQPGFPSSAAMAVQQADQSLAGPSSIQECALPADRMPRSLASLTIAFGLVAIPVRLYSVTKRSTALRFKWMTSEGDAVRQRLVPEPAGRLDPEPERLGSPASWGAGNDMHDMPSQAAPQDDIVRELRRPLPSTPQQDQAPASAGWPEEDEDAAGPYVGRADLQKGLEIEPGKFVLFTQAELDELATPRRDSIDLVSFVPPHAVDPLYVDKSYYLAPARRAERPYALLLQALQQTRRCALARWAWRGREHPALIRPGDGVLVLHQLQSGDAVRDASELEVELPAVSGQELQLAVQLVEQSSAERFEPMDYIDPAKQRVLDAARRKLAGGAVFGGTERPAATESAEVIDLVAALRASLAKPAPTARRPARRASSSAGPKKGVGHG